MAAEAVASYISHSSYNCTTEPREFGIPKQDKEQKYSEGTTHSSLQDLTIYYAEELIKVRLKDTLPFMKLIEAN